MINLIKNYINNLDKESVNKYLVRKNINLNEKELELIYYHLKNNWYTFLYEDANSIINNIKENIDNDNFLKLYELYIWAKEKYSIYL